MNENSQNESLSKPIVNQTERIENDFHFEENFKIENWENFKHDYFQSLVTKNNVKFKFLIRKMSKDAIKFLVLKESVTKQCSALIKITLTNLSTKKKITREIHHNYNFESLVSEIIFDLQEFHSDTNRNINSLNIHLTIEHKSSKQNLENETIEEKSKIIESDFGANLTAKTVSSSSSTAKLSPYRSSESTDLHQKKKNEELLKIFDEETKIPRIRRRNLDDTYSITAEQYCGLRNQGSTCYMNSMLQSLFHLPIFRSLMYQIDVDPNSDRQSNIIWNLKQLFAQLSESSDSVSTRALTNSFGWNDDNVLDNEQDLFEFYCLILDLLTKKLKGTKFESELHRIFFGKARNFFRCLHVPVSKGSVETFNNISLEIKSFRNMEESLKGYLTPELFEGDNQYKTEEFGLQDAEMGVEFLEFPLVLYIHLNRIGFDAKKRKMVRNNSKFEFPLSIDMAEYLAKDSPQRDQEMVYDLFGVLVHAGEATSGHFYAYLRTNPKDDIDKWFMFNDSAVSFANKKQAVTDNFGGKKNDGRQHFSAYMLIYMRRNELPRIFCPVETSMISGFTQNAENDMKKSDENVPVQIYTINHIEPETFEFVKPIQMDVPVNSNFEEFYKIVSKRLKTDNILMWYCYNNRIFGEIDYTTEYGLNSISSSSFFVEKFNGVRKDIIVFIAFFDNSLEGQKIRLLQSLPVAFDQKIFSILPIVESHVDIKNLNNCDNENLPFLAFIYNNNQIKEVSIYSTFGDNINNDGAFVIFQLTPQKESLHEAPVVEIRDVPFFYANNENLVQKYYDHFANELPVVVDEYFTCINSSISLIIHDLYVVSNGKIILKNTIKQTLAIPGFFNFEHLKKFVLKLYGIEFDNSKQSIFFYKGNDVCPIADLLNDGIYDKIIKETIDEDEKLHVLITDDINCTARIEWAYVENPLLETKSMITSTNFFNSYMTASDLHSALGLSNKNEYRLVNINPKKESIKTVFNNSSLLHQLNNPIRIEIIPDDQKNLSSDEFLIKCRKVLMIDDQFQSQRPMPSPFLLNVSVNEPFSQTKETLESSLEIKKRLKPKFILSTLGKPDKDILDEDILSDLVDESSQIIIIFPREHVYKNNESDGLTILS